MEEQKIKSYTLNQLFNEVDKPPGSKFVFESDHEKTLRELTITLNILKEKLSKIEAINDSTRLHIERLNGDLKR